MMKKIARAVLFASLAVSCAAQAMVVRGYGTAALKGHDLTDPENNASASSLVNYNATLRSSVEPYFYSEGAFNVFDNQVGSGDAKWCCDAGNVWVEADFGNKRYALTGFTAASGNDAPDRDSDNWKILGSNDGINYTQIFAYNKLGVSPWASRFQVNEYTAGVDFATPAAFSIFRYQSTHTVGNWMHQINELEFFGNEAKVPEPASFGLVGLGLAGIAVMRRRARQPMTARPASSMA
jgi:hypothetical protein